MRLKSCAAASKDKKSPSEINDFRGLFNIIICMDAIRVCPNEVIGTNGA